MFVYRISDRDKLTQVINLINGKFTRPKTKYLSRAIDHLNLLYNTKIQKLPLDLSNLDYWPLN